METVAALIESYAQRYSAYDAAGVSDLCEVPFLAVREGRAIHVPDRATLVDHFSRIMATYLAAGFASFEPADLDLRALGDRAAFVTVRWHALDAAGRLTRESWTSYQALATDSGWRLLSYVNHH